MNILDIYTRYTIPPNLQRHMLEVTAVGQFIAEHWKGPGIDKNLLTQTLLLHDMGNIVKFKKPFLGELAENSTYWEDIQQQFIQKYGTNAHDATEAIVRELHVSKAVQETIIQMRANPDGSTAAVTWEAKIADCADLCVSPEGIVGLEKRLADFMKRYHLNETDPVVIAWTNNAKEVAKYMVVDMNEIPKQDFNEEIKQLQHAEITTD